MPGRSYVYEKDNSSIQSVSVSVFTLALANKTGKYLPIQEKTLSYIHFIIIPFLWRKSNADTISFTTRLASFSVKTFFFSIYFRSGPRIDIITSVVMYNKLLRRVQYKLNKMIKD